MHICKLVQVNSHNLLVFIDPNRQYNYDEWSPLNVLRYTVFPIAHMPVIIPLLATVGTCAIGCRPLDKSIIALCSLFFCAWPLRSFLFLWANTLGDTHQLFSRGLCDKWLGCWFLGRPAKDDPGQQEWTEISQAMTSGTGKLRQVFGPAVPPHI